MTKIFFGGTLLLASLSLPTHAGAVDFNGLWKGTGTSTDSRGSATNCANVLVELEHTATTLVIKHYDATCGFLSPEWGPYPMQIDGSKVLISDDGEISEVGTLEGNLLRTMLPPNYAFNLRITGEGKDAVLETYYGVRSAFGAIVIEGALRRQ